VGRTAVSGKDVEIGARMARLQRSVTQQGLARSLKLTFQQVQKYEKGINHISAVRLHQIARLLGVEIEYFYENLNAESTGTHEKPITSLSELVRTSESLALLMAFNQIRSKPLRTCVLSLVRALIGKE
jgi:transcriptional regulator with XRE-family HTH domain